MAKLANHPQLSIIIRTRNEAKELKVLLQQIVEQKDLPTHEIIIVDNDSSDGLQSVLNDFDAKCVSIASNDFSYPAAWNIGLAESTGDYIAFLSAHAEMAYDTYFSDGLKHFNTQTAGVYTMALAMRDAPVIEKAIYAVFRVAYFEIKKLRFAENIDYFGTGGAFAKGDLIRQTKFDESYAAGGEDAEWGNRIRRQGFELVPVKSLKLYHSHRLGIAGNIRQLRNWRRLGEPREFQRETLKKFRTNRF